MLKHYLTELDLDAYATHRLLQLAAQLKKRRSQRDDLRGKHVGLYFEKPSVRTRVSFTVAVHELGGHVVELGGHNTKVGKGEDVEDFAMVLNGYLHCLVARVFAQNDLVRMTSRAKIPVINALSDERHPCQALADMLTILERRGKIEGSTITFIGEGNNVAASLALLGAMLGAEVRVASPVARGLPEEITTLAAKLPGHVVQLEDPLAAARGADVVYTDTWVSMGRENDAAELREAFNNYRIDDRVLSAAPNAIVMHCLPAVHGEEIEPEIMYGAQSAIWDQAENRLHVQKALLLQLLG